MGLFSDLFNLGSRRRIENLMNPLLEMKLQEFVIADDDSVYTKHYFRFKNKEGKDEEFVVIYRRFDSELAYLHTHHRRSEESFFVTVSEQVWSFYISNLIELGTKLSSRARPRRGHFVSNVSAGILRHPDFRPVASPFAKKPEEPSPI